MRWRIISTFSVIVMSLLIGLLAGANILGSDRFLSSNDETKPVNKNEGKLIAVVNLDSGVEKEGESNNFASPIIETLNDSYKIVSYKLAEEGLLSGTYDAVVCFPADFSQKVSSVNIRNPQKIKLDYEINTTMEEDKYVDTYSEVLDLQTYVNGTLSYTYIYSIYDELHLAQGQVSKLFANDKKDMTALENVKAGNFGATLDMSDMSEVKFEPAEIDFETYKQNVNTFAQDISKIYLDSYNLAKKDYTKVAAQVSNEVGNASKSAVSLVGEVKSWEGLAETWRDAADAQITKYNTSADMANLRASVINEATVKLNSAVAAYNDRVDIINTSANIVSSTALNINSEVSNINQAIDNVNNASAQHDTGLAILCNHIEEMTKVDKSSVVSYGAVLMKWGNALEDYVQNKKYENGDPVPKPSPLMHDLEKSAKSAISSAGNNTALMDILDDPNYLNTNISKVNEVSGIPNMPALEKATGVEEVTGIPTVGSIQAPPTTITIDPTNLKNDLIRLRTTTLSYDPLSYLTAKDRSGVDIITGKYSTEIDTVKGSFDTANTANMTLLNDTFAKYNTHIGDLRTDVSDAYEEETKNLGNVLKTFIDTKNITSKDNRKLLGEFKSMMPNSKSNAAVNTKLVEFIADPVELVKGDIRNPIEEKTHKINIYVIVAIGLLLLVTAFAVTMSVRTGRKAKDIK